MIAAGNHTQAEAPTLLGRIARLGISAIQTRVELLAVEWQEERLRFMDVLVCAMGLLLLGTLGFLFLTVTIILLFPPSVRLYVTAAFAGLYLLGAGGAWFALRNALKRQPFAESIDQVRKDRLWLESLK